MNTRPAEDGEASRLARPKAKIINYPLRRRDAIELHRFGGSHARIAEALGYSNAKAVARDIRKYLIQFPEATATTEPGCWLPGGSPTS